MVLSWLEGTSSYPGAGSGRERCLRRGRFVGLDAVSPLPDGRVVSGTAGRRRLGVVLSGARRREYTRM